MPAKEGRMSRTTTAIRFGVLAEDVVVDRQRGCAVVAYSSRGAAGVAGAGGAARGGLRSRGGVGRVCYRRVGGLMRCERMAA